MVRKIDLFIAIMGVCLVTLVNIQCLLSVSYCYSKYLFKSGLVRRRSECVNSNLLCLTYFKQSRRKLSLHLHIQVCLLHIVT